MSQYLDTLDALYRPAPLSDKLESLDPRDLQRRGVSRLQQLFSG